MNLCAQAFEAIASSSGAYQSMFPFMGHLVKKLLASGYLDAEAILPIYLQSITLVIGN